MTVSTVHVAMATDRAYLPWAAVAALSCQRALMEGRLHLHVLHEGDLTTDDRRRFSGMVEDHGGAVSYHTVDEDQLADLPSKGPELGGRTSWIRILLPQILPELERIVYLDADTLVVDSVQLLWTTPLDHAGVAAVSNVVEPDRRAHVANLGITDARQYFNAGVLVMNLQLMREEDTLGRIKRCVAERGDELSWFDQDALNLVFAGRWKPLAPRWNAQNSFWYWGPWAREVFGGASLNAALSNPAILHFEGPSFIKPWHYLCQHPYRDAYRGTLAETPWRGVPLLERNAATRMIRLLPRSKRLPAYLRLHAVKARRAQSSPMSRESAHSEKVLVVIPVYGQHEMTHELLGDLAREAHMIDVVVVDNKGDYSATGGEHVLRPGSNLGWAGGTNYGTVERRLPEHVAFMWLNNDTRLSSGFVAGLVRCWHETGAALVAPMYDCHWLHQRPATPPAVGHYRPRSKDYPAAFVDGTCMFVPASTVDAVGLLDDETFAPIGWGAEIDYGLRVRAAGLDVRVTALSYLHHDKTATGKIVYEGGVEEYATRGFPVAMAGLQRKWGDDWRRLAGIDPSTQQTSPPGWRSRLRGQIGRRSLR